MAECYHTGIAAGRSTLNGQTAYDPRFIAKPINGEPRGIRRCVSSSLCRREKMS